jgi:hypothetical protein
MYDLKLSWLPSKIKLSQATSCVKWLNKEKPFFAILPSDATGSLGEISIKIK